MTATQPLRSNLEALAKEQGPQVLFRTPESGRSSVCRPDPPAQCKAGDPRPGILSADRDSYLGITMQKNEKKESPYNYAYFVLHDDRSRLYERIDRRVDRMLEEGLVEEVKSLKARGLGRDKNLHAGAGIQGNHGVSGSGDDAG